jgi:hypothetical protein
MRIEILSLAVFAAVAFTVATSPSASAQTATGLSLVRAAEQHVQRRLFLRNHRAVPRDCPLAAQRLPTNYLAGERNTLNPLGSLVLRPPFGESVERRNKGATVLGEAVLGRENRSLVKFAPRNDAVGLEIAQML